MDKQRVKHRVKQALAAIGSPSTTPDARILTYHSIGDRRHDMTVSAEAFDQQMAWLVNNTAIRPLAKVTGGAPGVAITFDDGFRDNLELAAPILARHAITAHLFMVAGRPGGTLPDEPDRERGQLMNWDELRAWRDAGHGIGAHTLNHARLSHLSREEQEREILGSKTVLEDILAQPVDTFAYPYGSIRDYNAHSVELVKSVAFKSAFSNRYGVVKPMDQPFEIKRIWIDASDTISSFSAKVTGRLDALAWFDHPTGVFLRGQFNRARKEA